LFCEFTKQPIISYCDLCVKLPDWTLCTRYKCGGYHRRARILPFYYHSFFDKFTTVCSWKLWNKVCIQSWVIVDFTYLWNLRVFFWPDTLSASSSSYIISYHSNLVQMPLFFSLVVFQGRVMVASMSSITKGQGKFICTRFEWWETM
jgi:hypothetical protein